MRLIDANTTLKAIDKAISDYTEHDDILRLYSDLRLSVLDAKTVEAEPIRHGYWITHIMPKSYIEYGAICSRCGQWSGIRENFCPDCGAKMDGKENEK